MPTEPTDAEKAAANKALAAAAAPGCVWSNNNSACTKTWFCLTEEILGQLPPKASADFDVAGDVKMSELAFWNKHAPANREAEASSIADMLTKLFTNMVGATYEPGHNYGSAVPAMATVLADGDKTVCEFAAVVDEIHHFRKEKGNA